MLKYDTANYDGIIKENFESEYEAGSGTSP